MLRFRWVLGYLGGGGAGWLGCGCGGAGGGLSASVLGKGTNRGGGGGHRGEVRGGRAWLRGRGGEWGKG